MSNNHELEQIKARAKSFSQRDRKTHMATAALKALAVLILGVLLTSALDILLALPAYLRLASLIGTLFLSQSTFRQEIKTNQSSTRAAQIIESSFSELGSSLSTAIEFGTDTEKTSKYSSEKLVEKLVKSAEARTRTIPLQNALDFTGLKRALSKLAIYSLVIASFAIFLPQQASRTTLRFFAPLSATPSPTWTTIDALTPGSGEVPLNAPVTIEVTLGGFKADAVTLHYRQQSSEWTKLSMAQNTETKYARTLGAITKPTEYKIHAGDAWSPVCELIPIEELKITELSLTLTPPEYTSSPKIELPQGEGEFSGLEGTEVQIKFHTNRAVQKAQLLLHADGKEKTLPALPLDASEKFSSSFRLKENGQYTIHLQDKMGRTNVGAKHFSFKVIKDLPPEVRIKSPKREVSTPKDRDVKITMQAKDDFGIKEMGLKHTLLATSGNIVLHSDSSEPKTILDATHQLRLALFSLKGGEIITYYIYAVDAAGQTGRSQVQFIWTWGENKYDSDSMQSQRSTSAIEVEDYIKNEIAIIRALGNKTLGTKNTEEQNAIKRTAQDQKDLATDLDEFVKEVQDGEDKTQTDERALAHMIKATTHMTSAAEALSAPNESKAPEGNKNTQVQQAIDFATQAVAELSRSRRIIMGKGEGQSAFDIPSQNRSSERNTNRQKATSQLRKKANRLPPMLEAAKKMRRKLEKLEDAPPSPRPQSSPASSIGQDELAEQARSLAQELSEQNLDTPQMSKTPERKLKEAADKIERSKRLAENGNLKEARQKMEQAERALEQTQATLNQTLDSFDAEQMRALSSHANELARRQKKLAQSGTDKKASEKMVEQNTLSKELNGLEQKISSRLENLENSQARYATQNALSELERAKAMMQMAQMNGGQENSSENKAAQMSAADSLEQAAEAMSQAAQSFANKQRDALSRAEQKARELSKEISTSAKKLKSEQTSLHPSGRELESLKTKAAKLATEVRSLNRSGENDAKEMSANSLDSAERRLKEAVRAKQNQDMKTALDKINAASQRAQIAANLLSRTTQDELGRLLRDAAKKATTSANNLTKAASALQQLAAAQNNNNAKDSDAKEQSAKAASDINSSERKNRELANDLLYAKENAARQEHKLTPQITQLHAEFQENNSSFQQERIKEHLKAKLSAKPKDKISQITPEDIQLAKELAATQKEFAQKLSTLAAESSTDELQKLKAIKQDATRLKNEFQKIARALTEPTSTELPSATKLKQLASSTKWLQQRAEENSLNISESQKSILETTQKELQALARAKLRNQPSNISSGSFRAGTEVMSSISSTAFRKTEAVIKKRNFGAPQNELAPTEYRELVRQYFRALSED